MPKRNPVIFEERRWALIPSQASKNSQIAIFVHGYLGQFLSTWGQFSSLAMNHADNDPILSEWDFLFLGYEMSSVQTYLDIARLISNEWRAASEGLYPFCSQYKRVALVGHSLGTLGIRQLLCAKSLQTTKFIQHLKCVLLFGSPVVGSLWAKLGAIPLIPGTEALKALERGNPQLRMLKEWTESSYNTSWPPLHVIHAENDAIVSSSVREFCHWKGDSRVDVETGCGHLDLVKPKTWDNSPLIHHLRRDLSA